MIKKIIAEDLLEIEAVTLRPNKPFTWSSGIQSPIYCDNRMTLSYPAIRNAIAHGLSDIIAEKFPYCDVIAGTSTAGIPHAAWVSEILDLPMVYVRSEAKKHGKGNQIEGKITAGQKVIVIEDLISSGGSAITCAKALQQAGCEVLAVVAIFTYELEKGKRLFVENALPVYSLCNYSTLVNVAQEKGYITETELMKLEKWRQNPEDTSWIG